MASAYIEQWLQRKYGPRPARAQGRRPPLVSTANSAPPSPADHADTLTLDEQLEDLVRQHGSPELQTELARLHDRAARGLDADGELAVWMTPRAVQRRARRARDRLLFEAMTHFTGNRQEQAAALHHFIASLPRREFRRATPQADERKLRRLVREAYQCHELANANESAESRTRRHRVWPPSERLLSRLEPAAPDSQDLAR